MGQMKNKNINKGAASVVILFVLLFLLLFTRFLYIEITKEVDGKELNTLAQELWTTSKTLEAHRGSIYDRKGNVLAQDIPSYTIYAILDRSYPNHVKDPEETAKQLAPILGASKENLEKILKQKKRFQVEFGAYGRKLTQKQKNKIEELNLPGIGFERETKRYYPNQVFASHIIGFVNENEQSDIQEGVMGLEKSLNKYLIEKNGSVTFKRDGSGTKLPVPDEKIEKPQNGKSVYLTIDENIQLFVEQALNEIEKEYKPERAIAIVANPKTGEILALGNRPSFNPNKRDIANYSNDAISSRFEPGSTMKVFTLAAAIEEGVYNGQEKYQSGKYKVAGGVISDHNNGEGWGSITFDEGVRRSSNVAFSKLAKEKLGFNRLYQYLTKFGFREKTGIDLPDEANSAFRYEAEIEKVTTSFGQGTAVTPIQQIQAATAIANNGVMMRPYVTRKIIDPETDEIILENKPKSTGKPISPETASKVLDILETVVTDGTGQPFAIEGYDIAGKTGTAQIPSPNGGYMKGWGKNIYSFIGMAPKNDPKLVVYVAVDRPKLKGFETGSQATGKLFTSITKNSLQHLNIEPDASEDSKKALSKNSNYGLELEDYAGKKLEEARKELENKGFKVEALGNKDSLIQEQIPYPGSSVLNGERIILKGDGEIKMPNLKGWSLADALKVVEILQLEPKINGSGYVVKQSIKPKESVREKDQITIQLAPPE
ncbi:penicillin-binding protein [Pueribacillus theae]|uniref:serine-type D-Ala-D-Ala carboxypeptidase n=1 Tax=Pueribacillus theae TaxID=2171751 RepID=A0A2U1K8B6_9BACI|nr:penicillin-binding protein [Pueribacillus theae]PWA13403.1 penicillin-binding protein [Pueribacillus theae]